MSLLPEGASFEERVSDYFLACRGQGVMLTALDVELIGRWALERVPFEVVARGIDRAVERALWDARPGEPVLRSLKKCARQVNAEIAKHHHRTLGRGVLGVAEVDSPPPAKDPSHARFRSALKKMANEVPEVRLAVAALLTGVLQEEPADLGHAERLEQTVELVVLRALRFEVRLEVLKEAREQLVRTPALSWRGKKLARRFHRATVLRKRFPLPRF